MSIFTVHPILAVFLPRFGDIGAGAKESACVRKTTLDAMCDRIEQAREPAALVSVRELRQRRPRTVEARKSLPGVDICRRLSISQAGRDQPVPDQGTRRREVDARVESQNHFTRFRICGSARARRR
jgi:hypothetical protein